MANRKSFKSDISFLEKISMGATGTIAVFNNLRALGNAPIELERGSKSFKMWKELKIKRIRVPDILCIQCSNCVDYEFPRVHHTKRPGISWALSKAGRFTIRDMLELLVDDDARQWIAYIIGTQDQQRCMCEIEELKMRDKEVYFAVTVLWKIMTSWIWGLEEY